MSMTTRWDVHLGEAGRCKLRIYITAGQTPKHLSVTNVPQVFGGHTLQWFEEERPGDKTFEEIIPLFEDKFSKPNTAEDDALVAQAHQLARNKDESLKTFIECTVLRMNDDGRDKRLQERVQDKLYTRAKWENSFADPTPTFDDVRNVIWNGRGAALELLKPFGNEDSRTEQRDMTILPIDSNQEMARLTSELAKTMPPAAGNGNRYFSNDNRNTIYAKSDPKLNWSWRLRQ
ncbi:hypothetical protein QSH57_004915 [Fusarium oxysporum f. sp. vasinfectum]|nr:hypothetical protein QSH57_004915 [Fusarium oxysporum f. sp. vasinfectum]